MRLIAPLCPDRQAEKRSGNGSASRCRKSYLKEDEAFNRYLSELWGDYGNG